MTEKNDREIPQDRFVAAEHVEVSAYYKWQNRGCPPNDSLKDWEDAHKEFKQMAVPEIVLKTQGSFMEIL